MKKTELLSPAGNIESLKMAVNNGCDAVYIGGKKFGARAFSSNFTNDEIKDAINYCHLFNIKVYVTVNTIIYEDEVIEFLNYIDFLHENNVDAVILQDIGMASLVHQIYPNLVLHASTQMNIHTIDQLKTAKELGFKRVVLAREVDFDTIKKMKEEVNIEIEVFVHGALCISYSGQCLLSYMVGKRSGNRGECAGICRQPYKIYKENNEIKLNDKYLLSTKDLCLINKIDELIKIGVDSFKIEGRMKSPEYVGIVTRNYRNKIDGFDVDENNIENMKKIFYRGYTLGKTFNKDGKEFINGIRPNNIGYCIGTVINCNNGKIKAKIDKSLKQGDGIRILSDVETGFIVNKIYINNLLVNMVENQVVILNCKEKVKIGSKIYKTYDKELSIFINESTKERKIQIDGIFKTIKNDIFFEVTDGNITIEKILKNAVTKAKNKPTTSLEIREKLNKLNNEVFVFNKLEISIDNESFIPLSIINNLRRNTINELKTARINKINNYKKENYKLLLKDNKQDFSIKFETNNEENIKYLINKGYKVYTSDYLLYLKNKCDNLIYKNSRVNPTKLDETFLSGDISNIKNNICDTSFNVVNSYSVALLHKLGAQIVTTSYELDINKISKLIDNYKDRYNTLPNLEVVIYGKVEVMISKYCPLKTYVKKTNNCDVCKNSENYYLVDKFNNKYKIKKSNDCLTRLIDYKNINYLDKVKYLRKIGVNNVRIVLDEENINDIKMIIKKIKLN